MLVITNFFLEYKDTKNISVTTKNTYLFIGILGLLSGLTPFAVDMYLPSIPNIARDVHSSVSSIQLTISVFIFSFAIGQLFYGPLSDCWGRKKVLLSGLFLFIVASLLVTQAHNLEQLLFWRSLQAFGGGAVGVCVNATLRDRYRGNQLAKMMSYLLIVIIIAPMIAPFVGGQILKYFAWPVIFYILSALGIISLVLYLLFIGESHKKEKRHKLELKTILSNYMAIIKDRQSLAYLLIGSFSSAPMFIFITSSPFVYLNYFNISEQDFGYYFGANVVLMMASSWLNSHLLNRIPYQRIMVYAIVFRMLPATALLLVGLFADEHLFLYLVPLIVVTIGLLPLVGPNAMTGLMDKHGDNAGSAASLAGAFRFSIGAIAGMLASVLSNHNHLSMVIGMFVFTAACLVASLWARTLSNNA